MTIHGTIVAAVSLAPAALAAQAGETAPAVGFAPGLIQATLGLAIVLGLIWGTAWVIRRLAPMATRPNSPIKIITTQSVGQRERVVLIEVQDRWLLLGVAPGQISKLATLPKGSATEPSKTAPSFTSLFNRMRANSKGGAS